MDKSKKSGWRIYPRGTEIGSAKGLFEPSGRSEKFQVAIGETVAVCIQPYCHIRLVALIEGTEVVLRASPDTGGPATFGVKLKSFVTIGAGYPSLCYLLRLRVTDTNADAGWVEFSARQL
ncbi:MAG: hypothetical protein Q7S84_02320 [bacterium]|nr:hypothetical protein [bacterium]